MVQSHLVPHNEIIYDCTAGTTLRATKRAFGGSQHHEFLTWLGLPKSGSEIPTKRGIVHDLLLNYFTLYGQTPVANL